MVMQRLASAPSLTSVPQMEPLVPVLMEMLFGFHGHPLNARPVRVAEFFLERTLTMLTM
jgi:hypothetical protein